MKNIKGKIENINKISPQLLGNKFNKKIEPTAKNNSPIVPNKPALLIISPS